MWEAPAQSVAEVSCESRCVLTEPRRTARALVRYLYVESVPCVTDCGKVSYESRERVD